jgi:N-acetylmuramoyl-L-alanine amidase
MVPEFIIIHHSLTKDSRTVSWNAIRRYHTETLGYDDIGYHYGVELVDDDYRVMIGRSMEMHGAHCRELDMNFRSLGVCLIGNFDLILPPVEQWTVAVQLVNTLRAIHNIPVERVLGHNECKPSKSCPGYTFSMSFFRGCLSKM